jgi:catechol 2,3-dioxygenase-like lactoylglutathione lyase family enzyme
MSSLDSAVSLAASPVVAFVATRDAARARAFYESTLGLRVVADTPFALVVDAGGTTIRVQKVKAFTPHPFTALGWTVGDIARMMAALRERGVVFQRFEFVPQDAHGVWTTPDGSKVAWFQDPDGNTLSLTEHATSVRSEEKVG